ncbi:hypothetical protein [Microbispora amethystogenes]|uniref:Integral membrane protein n=1 Tax=Microbispora amethystogenes TaxID=1427754 RepID=A0ABQ4FPW8_9ACTN|nr:hypothetical protein [Microbispora amethystogenes]GIH36865.1 hypothetical protein Mam01_70290 [Microbispora amethystogenes]
MKPEGGPSTGRLVSAGRWLIPAVLAIEVLLLVTGMIDFGTGARMVLIVESLLFGLVLLQARSAWSVYRAARADGCDEMGATGAALDAVLPAPAAAVLKQDLLLWRALYLAARRRKALDADEVAIAYGREVRTIMWLVMVVDGVLLVVVHLALPWPAVRMVLFVVTIIGLLWLAGFLAALHVYPHAIGPRRLRLRFASFYDVCVPVAMIKSVRVERGGKGLLRSAEVVGGTLVMEVSSSTNIVIELTGTHVVKLRGREHPITRVRCYADDPVKAVEMATGFVGGADGSTPMSA